MNYEPDALRSLLQGRFTIDILTPPLRLRTTNAVERLHQELKRRSKVVRIFPNSENCLRLFGAMTKDQHKDWITGRQYLKMDQLKGVFAKPPKRV